MCLKNLTNFFYRYCLADERLEEAVKFLDLGDRAGWELLQVFGQSNFLCIVVPSKKVKQLNSDLKLNKNGNGNEKKI